MKKFFVSCFFLLLPSLCLRAQIANNTALVGTAFDPTGSTLSDVKVTAIEETTKVKSAGTTNSQGYFAITFVAPGIYDITMEKAGFSKVTKTGVIVPVDQAVRTDFSLPVGSADASITVTANNPPMSTDDATLGETFNSQAVEDLPVQGHNAMDIAATASNVQIGGKTSYTGTPPGEDLQGAGQREIQNIITVDGVSILNDLVNTTPGHPSGEMIGEVQMQSGNYSAQYGGYLGIHVNMVSKNGTNDLHGSVYDEIRNTALNAYPYTANSLSQKPTTHINEYGFAVGGPVVLPRLYNGRNRTFFFGSYDKFQQIAQAQGVAQTIPQAFENGDFSLLGPGFNTTTNSCPTGTQCIVDPATGNYYLGNQIPQNELNTSAAAIAKKYEAYFAAPTSAGYLNNLNYTSPNDLFIKQGLVRIDENVSEKDKFFFRYYAENLTFLSPAAIPVNASSGPTNTRDYALGYTRILSPNMVNEFHFGALKLISENLNYFYTHGLKSAGTQLGIPGFTGDTLYNNPGVPCLNVSGYQVPCNSGSNWFQDDRGYDLYDQVSYAHGKHQIMAGFEIHRVTLGREATNNPVGALTVSGGTPTPGTPGVSTGFAPADFVLGYLSSDTTPIDTIKGSVKEYRDGFFILDNWQASQRLTINYGFRYDLPLGATSLNGYGRMLNASQTALIPTSTASLGANYAPTPGFQFTPAQKDNIGPRLGLDYRVNERLVFRAGGGMYYEPNQLNTYTLLTSNYPFAAAIAYTTTAASPLTFTNTTPGAGSAPPVAGVAGTYVSAYTPELGLKTQRAYQWNGDLGYSLWKDAAFEAQYQGSRSLHLDRSFYDNQPLHPLNLNSVSLNSERPNQLFGEIRVFQEDGFSTYHALTTILRQRAYHGVSGQISYTWAHDIDLSADSNGGGTLSQQYNPKADYGDANWDIRNRLTATFTYAMPRLATKDFVTRELLGGWHVNGFVNLQSGTPYTISMGSNQASAGVSQGTERPSWAHSQHTHCTLKNAFYTRIATNASCIDETAYIPAVNYTSSPTGPVGFGNIHRNSLHGPGFQFANLSVFKDFQLYQRLKFSVQANAYNVTNHPSAANPNSSGIGIYNAGSSSCPTTGAACLNFQNISFGQINGVQSTPGQTQGARVIEVVGKIVF